MPLFPTTATARTAAIGVLAAGVLLPILSMQPASAAGLCSPPTDTVPPAVTNLTLSPQAVNLNSGSRTVTVTVDAVDTSAGSSPSGVRSVRVDVRGPDTFAYKTLRLSSGTAADGTWTGTFTVPKSAKAGTVSLQDVDISDHRNNTQDYTEFGSTPQSPTDIRLQSGWQSSVTVTGTTTKPPKRTKVPSGALTSFTLPALLDTTKAAGNLHATATFSGPKRPTRVSVYLQRSSGHGPYPFRPFILKHKSGDVWAGHIRLNRWVGDQTYKAELSAYFGRYATPRDRNYNPDRLTNDGYNDVVKIVSGVDKSKPKLTGLTISPSPINTVPGPQTVTVTAHATDTKSGVDRIDADIYTKNGDVINTGSGDVAAAPTGGLYPYHNIGYGRDGAVNFELHHTTGNTWTGTGVFRKCVPLGEWHVNVSLNDKAGNYTSMRPKKLQEAGLPSSVTVQSTPGDIVAPYVYGSTASSQDGTVTLDFSEGVKNVTTSTLTLFAMQPASKLYQSAVPISVITCSNGHTTVDCSGSGGLITSAVLTTPALQGKVGKRYQVFANQDSVTSQLTDGLGNPLDWNNGAAEVTDS